MAEKSECTHDCASCSENCESRDPKSFIEKPNKLSRIGKVIGVVSGKGGVGKSLVTSMLAVEFARRGFKTAILDADITGPSIPKAFGVHGEVEGSEDGIFPLISKTGVRIMSVNLLLDEETKPVVWRGPVIAGTVKQFWTDVVWDEVDYMFVDMPPGTGDVPLTVFQSIPLDGIVIVTSPQELVAMIVAKAFNMARLMNINVLGLVENMSYAVCPDCGRKIEIFGKSSSETVAASHGIPVLAKIPLDPTLAGLCDKGMIEKCDGSYISPAVDVILKK